MKRSELIDSLIIEARNAYENFIALGTFIGSDSEAEKRKITLDVLLDEQKREEGCAYCNTQTCGNCTGKFTCSRAGCSNEYAAQCTMFDAEKYCERCGKRLTDGESE